MEGNVCAAHLEEGNALALVENEVVVGEGRLGGHAFVASAELILQRVLHTMKRSENKVISVNI